jgi:tetratricopeptide (TPR) repeat protein
VPTILQENTDRQLCNHGWIHNDRLATIDYSSFHIPETKTRKTTTLALSLQSPEEYFNQGITLIEQQLYAEAAEAFFSAIQLQWDLTAAHIELGNAYSGLKQFDKALQAYSDALENEPGSVIAHYNVALTHLDLKQYDESLKWTSAVIKLNRKYQIAYTLLARILLATNQREQALAQLLTAAKLSKPHNPDILVQAGSLYEKLDQTSHALRCYRRALKSDPWHADAFYSIGLIQFNAGQFTAANLSIANAINTRPKFPEAKTLLKKLKKELIPKKPRRSRTSDQTELFTTPAAA